MRRFFTLSLMALASTCVTARGGVINFSDQSLSPNSYINGGPSTNSFGFHSGGAYLNNNYSSDYGGYWNGWSLSNVNNTGTDYPAVPDFGGNHLYAAYPGGGVGGTSSVYAVGDWDGFDPMYIDLPAGQRPTSVDLTNTTDDVLSMQYGDPFAKQFGPTDWFYVTLTGYTGPGATGTTTGFTDFYLAQSGSIVSTWNSVDLSALGDASSIGFTFASSDTGVYGINTPTLVALDDLSTAPVPEPASLGLVGLAAIMATGRRWRRRSV